jgi:hypothetical protein
VTGEPADGTVPVRLDLPALLPTVSVPAGHLVLLERLGLDAVVAVLGRADGTVQVELPDGSTSAYTLANSADHAALLEQIRSGTAGRVEGRFLMDALLNHGHLAKLEPLWGPSALARPVPFGALVDTLPGKAERYIHRIRLADQAGHISAGAAILPQITRVPSLRAPAAPVLDVPDSTGGTLTASARVRDAFDLRWLLLFALGADLDTPLDERMLDRPQLLRLPNRRDLYPQRGIRLRLRDGSLLAPLAVDAATGAVQLPDRVITAAVTPAAGFDRRVCVWAVALTRDGIPSRVTGPRTAFTGPVPLVVPPLAVGTAAGEDRASWSALTVGAQVALERSTDAGATWERVTPWLPESTTGYSLPAGQAASRRYRLLLRGTRGQLATGSAVTPT